MRRFIPNETDIETANSIIRYMKDETELKESIQFLHLMLRIYFNTEIAEYPDSPMSLGWKIKNITPILKQRGIIMKKCYIVNKDKNKTERGYKIIKI